MAEEPIFLNSLSIRGYRSFGDKHQYFDIFGRINLFIGSNNSGKSNILRLLHDVYPQLARSNPAQLNELDKHVSTDTRLEVGVSLSLNKTETGYDLFNGFLQQQLKHPHQFSSIAGNVLKAFQYKASQDGTPDVWFQYDQRGKMEAEGWFEAYKTLHREQMYQVWHALTDRTSGDQDRNWIPDTISTLKCDLQPVKVAMIPAIREVGTGSFQDSDFSGASIVEQLAKLQNPDFSRQNDKKRFEKINQFLRSVTGNNTAYIEIPYERDTILVHMDGKSLPIEAIGTGLHEVIILAAAATILENQLICIEEPELHLNPILQKKLVRYLMTSTNNQYFISTHSAALMDTPNAEIYHVNLVDGQSIISRVTSDKEKSAVCENLGYHPSDLLQSNAVIWVEGPSDRNYLNWWIAEKTDEFQEGIHYSIMFYGGRLAAHLSGEDIDIEDRLEGLISLRRLNRRSIILIDSDRTSTTSPINETKERLQKEFNDGPGFAWITEGREIENYLTKDQLHKAIAAVHPYASIPNNSLGKYRNNLKIKTKSGKEGQASKVGVSKYVVSNSRPDFKILDIDERVTDVIDFIREANVGLSFEDIATTSNN